MVSNTPFCSKEGNTMILSIIVPVYNMAEHGKLEYCLDSLLHQTIQNYEIIAVDDASQDASPEILKRYEETYPDKIHAIYLEQNHRQGGAKNAGLEAARGDYIGFMDSDDWAAPDMFEKLLARAQETGADMAGCDYCRVGEHTMEPTARVAVNSSTQSGVLDRDKYCSLILDAGSLVVKIYKRSMFQEPVLRFPEHMFYEDNAVAAALMLRAKHFEYLEEALYFYYQHEASTVHHITEEKCRDRMEAMRLMIQYAKEDGSLQAYPEEFEYRFINLFYQNTLFSYLQGAKHKKLSFVKGLGKEMKEHFPNFQRNSYYLQRTDKEEKKLIALQQRSTVVFWIYYHLLRSIRRIKGRLRSGH